MTTEGEFINHCDEPECGLGAFWYHCPCCGKRGTDYGDVWYWYQEDYMYSKGEESKEFECEHCENKLNVSWNSVTFSFDVTYNKNI